jgi:hypothetical protein
VIALVQALEGVVVPGPDGLHQIMVGDVGPTPRRRGDAR